MFRKILVDSDVILDLLLARPPYFPAAARLFTAFQEGQLEGYVSSLSFSNLFYLLRKHSSGPDAVALLRKLHLITRVAPVDEKVVDLALAADFSDFEDALQYFAAVEQGLDAIVTRNRRDYRSAKLPVLSAEECLDVAGL